MTNNIIHNTPPVIRVFLSSTFADMDKERSYFNEVLAPKISRICAERGVSFFSVDLRWGITKEDQIDGKVLPICLNEIDKCRPYFIGIIGNRYGSILETVPYHISQSIPWLSGKEGHSITELEMLYAVLDSNTDFSGSNTAFYIRSDELSKKLYGNIKTEDQSILSRLYRLKSTVMEREDIPSATYDSIEEFGKYVMSDLLKWLDTNFPKSHDVSAIRKEWYNREILRNYIESPKITAFLDYYTNESKKPLLLYGDGARGKTTHLTAWQPKIGKKILINCGADDKYSYWPSIAKEIIDKISEIDGSYGYPVFYPRKSVSQSESNAENNDLYFSTDTDIEKFRRSFISWLGELTVNERITVIINDVNLLEDDQSKILSWLPAFTPSNLGIICTTNDDYMVEIAELLGWNTKELPTFELDDAEHLLNGHLHTYGKHLSPHQQAKLTSSVLAKYPGQLRFIVTFLINHGRFDNLDTLIEEISSIRKMFDIYQYVYDFLMTEYSQNEIATIKAVLGLVRSAKISLTERECFELSQNYTASTAIEWAHVCRVFEQFDIIKGDYWNIRNEELQKFVDSLLSKQDLAFAHSLLGDYFFEQLKALKVEDSNTENIKRSASLAKVALLHYQNSKEWDKLLKVVSDKQVLYCLCELDNHYIRSAFIKLFLHSKINIGEAMTELVESYQAGEGYDKKIAVMLASIYQKMGYRDGLDRLCDILQIDSIKQIQTDREIKSFLSEEFTPIYDQLCKITATKRYRQLLEQLKKTNDKSQIFNDFDRCALLFFEAEGLYNLGLFDEALNATNNYYTVAVKTGIPAEMLTALFMRGSILYRHQRYTEAANIQNKVAYIALENGDLQTYLAALHTITMCRYHQSKYDISIMMLDMLGIYYNKLSDSRAFTMTQINKFNALRKKGETKKALELAEELYGQIADDENMSINAAELLGNMGSYAIDLQLYDKAEEYLLLAINKSKSLEQESILSTAYNILIDLYISTEQFQKILNIREEQMELMWSRCEYSELISVLNETMSLLLHNKYISLANKLEAFWKERFSTIEGGAKYFESNIDTETIDSVNVEKLTQELILAKSSRDTQKEADIYYTLAETFEETDKAQATEYLLSAAKIYMSLKDDISYLNCIERAIILQFNNGKKTDDALCQKILSCANNESICGIVSIWEQFGNFSTNSEDLSHSPSQSNIYTLACELLSYINDYSSLVFNCLLDVAEYILKYCSVEEIRNISAQISYSDEEKFYERISQIMKRDMDKDISEAMNDYFSPIAIKKITFYEKCIELLKEFDITNAGALSGNIALIFRRRKEKEKTIYYHSLSMELYKKAGKQRDQLIEILNIATAHKEFGDPLKAIDILREGLEIANNANEGSVRAAIAGNLASYLIDTDSPDSADEIAYCFEIEENHFRSIGNQRELAISLLNQTIYYYKKSELPKILHKLEEAGRIVRENGFQEFMGILSKLEWVASQERKSSDTEDQANAEEKIKKLLSANGKYDLVSIESTDNTYHFVCAASDQKIGAESLHIFCSTNLTSLLEIHCVYRPMLVSDKNNYEQIQKYVEWWNAYNIYKLSFDEEELNLRSEMKIFASDWDALSDRFNTIMELWSADKFSIQIIMLGMDISMCQGAKLKLLGNN